MSVLVSDRTESKFEAITYSVELHDMLIELMQRSFGVKDLDRLVRMRYAYGKDTTEDFSRYRYLMLNYKNRIDQLASMLTSNIRAANSIYPTTLNEYEQRRDYQNTAIVNCEQLLKELQLGFVRILCLTNREGDIVLSEGINSKAGRNLLR